MCKSMLSPLNQCLLTSVERNATPLDDWRNTVKVYTDSYQQKRLIAVKYGINIAAILLSKFSPNGRQYYVREIEGNKVDTDSLLAYARVRYGSFNIRENY